MAFAFLTKAFGSLRNAPITDIIHPTEASFGHFMVLADDTLGVMSVFDDLKYDRADLDLLGPAMRNHAILKLKPLGFRQMSGSALEQRGTGLMAHMPKFHALGSSPFDVARYTPKREEDFYILTPTQTACRLIDHYPKDEAVARIKDLIATQPVNLLKLEDYLEKSDHHSNFMTAMGYLKFIQREAVASDPLCRRRALR